MDKRRSRLAFFWFFSFSSHGIGLGVFSGGVGRCVAGTVIPCGFFVFLFCVLRCISWSGKGVVGYDHDDILSVG